MRIIYSICALVLVLALASKDYRPCCEACEYCSKVNNQKINLKHRHYDNLFVEHGVIPRPIDSIEKALDALETSLFLTFTPEESIALYNLHLSTKTGFGPSALKVHFATLGDQVVEYAEAVYNIFTSYYEVRNPLFSINAFFQLDALLLKSSKFEAERILEIRLGMLSAIKSNPNLWSVKNFVTGLSPYVIEYLISVNVDIYGLYPISKDSSDFANLSEHLVSIANTQADDMYLYPSTISLLMVLHVYDVRTERASSWFEGLMKNLQFICGSAIHQMMNMLVNDGRFDASRFSLLMEKMDVLYNDEQWRMILTESFREERIFKLLTPRQKHLLTCQAVTGSSRPLEFHSDSLLNPSFNLGSVLKIEESEVNLFNMKRSQGLYSAASCKECLRPVVYFAVLESSYTESKAFDTKERPFDGLPRLNNFNFWGYSDDELLSEFIGIYSSEFKELVYSKNPTLLVYPELKGRMEESKLSNEFYSKAIVAQRRMKDSLIKQIKSMIVLFQQFGLRGTLNSIHAKNLDREVKLRIKKSDDVFGTYLQYLTGDFVHSCNRHRQLELINCLPNYLSIDEKKVVLNFSILLMRLYNINPAAFIGELRKRLKGFGDIELYGFYEIDSSALKDSDYLSIVTLVELAKGSKDLSVLSQSNSASIVPYLVSTGKLGTDSLNGIISVVEKGKMSEIFSMLPPSIPIRFAEAYVSESRLYSPLFFLEILRKGSFRSIKASPNDKSLCVFSDIDRGFSKGLVSPVLAKVDLNLLRCIMNLEFDRSKVSGEQMRIATKVKEYLGFKFLFAEYSDSLILKNTVNLLLNEGHYFARMADLLKKSSILNGIHLRNLSKGYSRASNEDFAKFENLIYSLDEMVQRSVIWPDSAPKMQLEEKYNEIEAEYKVLGELVMVLKVPEEVTDTLPQTPEKTIPKAPLDSSPASSKTQTSDVINGSSSTSNQNKAEAEEKHKMQVKGTSNSTQPLIPEHPKPEQVRFNPCDLFEFDRNGYALPSGKEITMSKITQLKEFILEEKGLDFALHKDFKSFLFGSNTKVPKHWKRFETLRDLKEIAWTPIERSFVCIYEAELKSLEDAQLKKILSLIHYSRYDENTLDPVLKIPINSGEPAVLNGAIRLNVADRNIAQQLLLIIESSEEVVRLEATAKDDATGAVATTMSDKEGRNRKVGKKTEKKKAARNRRKIASPAEDKVDRSVKDGGAEKPRAVVEKKNIPESGVKGVKSPKSESSSSHKPSLVSLPTLSSIGSSSSSLKGSFLTGSSPSSTGPSPPIGSASPSPSIGSASPSPSIDSASPSPSISSTGPSPVIDSYDPSPIIDRRSRLSRIEHHDFNLNAKDFVPESSRGKKVPSKRNYESEDYSAYFPQTDQYISTTWSGEYPTGSLYGHEYPDYQDFYLLDYLDLNEETRGTVKIDVIQLPENVSRMELSRANFDKNYDELLDNIANADYVAFDMEMSSVVCPGLATNGIPDLVEGALCNFSFEIGFSLFYMNQSGSVGKVINWKCYIGELNRYMTEDDIVEGFREKLLETGFTYENYNRKKVDRRVFFSQKLKRTLLGKTVIVHNGVSDFLFFLKEYVDVKYIETAEELVKVIKRVLGIQFFDTKVWRTHSTGGYDTLQTSLSSVYEDVVGERMVGLHSADMDAYACGMVAVRVFHGVGGYEKYYDSFMQSIKHLFK